MGQAYPAFVRKDIDSDFGVEFPDFPGCVSAGATIDEALKNGAEALALHMAGMVEDGEDIPAPGNVEEVFQKADYAGAAIFFVSPDASPGRDPLRHAG